MMKLFLFLLCLTGVVPVILPLLQPVSHKYYLIQTKMTWPLAQNYCRETYDDLATVESDLDWLRLKTILAREGLTDVAWIGLYNDVNTWRFSFPDVPLKDSFTQWYTGQPDNVNGNETCCLSGPYGFWWDYACTLLFPFICFNGGKWLWSDGTNTWSLMWFAGQPDNYYSITNCAVLDNGFFKNMKCNELHYFICHTTHPVQDQQIVKLKVKSDTSIIDSVIQSMILELIKKKLDENGMLENTTLSWKVHSDGQIFHKNKKNNKP